MSDVYHLLLVCNVCVEVKRNSRHEGIHYLTFYLFSKYFCANIAALLNFKF